jgi:homocitrate synthase NifV
MIIDTTLREGFQLFNTYFDNEEKKEIIKSLAASGIEEIEAGWTGMKGIDGLFKWSGEKIENSIISVWSPCREKDIELAADYRIKRINIGVPSSKQHIEKRLETTKEELLERVSANVRKASLSGMKVTVGFEDLYGADFDFIKKAIKAVKSNGGFRIRFSDTRGLVSPLMAGDLISFFRNETDLEIGVHFHNDFGLASGNSVAALEKGADYTDASILGIGERAGITPLEEIASRLVVMNRNNYNLIEIKNLCMKVSKLADIKISRIKAFAGKDIFSCESGIHVHAMGKDPLLMEPYPPELTGEKRKTAIGLKTGKAAVKSLIEKTGIMLKDPQFEMLVENIKNLSLDKKRPLDKNELKLLIESHAV